MVVCRHGVFFMCNVIKTTEINLLNFVSPTDRLAVLVKPALSGHCIKRTEAEVRKFCSHTYTASFTTSESGLSRSCIVKTDACNEILATGNVIQISSCLFDASVPY